MDFYYIQNLTQQFGKSKLVFLNVKMHNIISQEQLDKYFKITREALAKAKQHRNKGKLELADDFLDMASRYVDDAQYFLEKKQDAVLAFAALNYAHGWLDAGARSGLFLVKDSRLFTVDDA